MTEKEKKEEYDKLHEELLFKGHFTQNYFTEEGKFQPALLSIDIRRIRHIVTLKDNREIYIYNEKGYYESNGEETLRAIVLIMNCRILKKWKKKSDEPRIVKADVIMDMNDIPFIEHITSWLEYKKSIGEEKYVCITRSRAYQILRELDDRIVGPHWLRHMRLSHLAETLSPFQLNERIGF